MKSVWPLIVFVVLLAIVCYEKDATWLTFFNLGSSSFFQISLIKCPIH